MRILIGAGGTGGHVYPALAVAEALRDEQTEHELVFVGTQGGGGFEERLVDESGVSFDAYSAVFAGPIAGVNPLRALSSIAKMGLGLLQSWRIIRRHRPQVMLFTGGWANVPVAVMGRLLNIPQLIYLPDIEPGSTIRVLSRFAQKVATTTPASEPYFKAGQMIVTGYPLRRSIMQATRADGLTHFGLSPDRPVLLVFGGSRGARSINLALVDILPQLLADGVQILHITGTLDWERVQTQTATLGQLDGYHAVPYLSDEMGLAFAVADLAVCRSGASVLGELPYFGLPSVLVPYPYAWRYQQTNATYLEERGAAITLPDADLGQQLYPMLKALFTDRDRLQAMGNAARSLSTGNGADNIARSLLELGEGL